MKLCVPTETDRGLAARLFDHFGSAPFLTMIDTETSVLKIIPNPGCSQPHQGRHHVQQLQKHRIDAVVCRGIGREALAALQQVGIQALAPAENTVSEVVTAIRQGRAIPLAQRHACGGGRRHAGRGRGRSGEEQKRCVHSTG